MSPTQPLLLLIIIGISLLALAFAVWLARWVLAHDRGTPQMQRITDAIQEGADAFVTRQYTALAVITTLLAGALYFGYGIFRRGSENESVHDPLLLALYVAVSFVLGALSSGVAGYVGMWVSIRASIRTASAASVSLDGALRIALRGGAVAGLFVVAISLLGVAGLYGLVDALAPADTPPEVWARQAPFLIVGYAFGASLVALFAQLGGGIYTKAADVAADFIGKVESGIPEDDPRNPAVIADLVGDNVGDSAGRGADLFESTAAENIGAMILGVLLYPYFGVGGILFPLVVRAFGLLASIAGIMVVRTREDGDPMSALNRGYYLAASLAAVGFYAASRWLLSTPQAPEAWWNFFLCGLIGIVASIAFVLITQYYTEHAYRPVKQLAEASQTGAATNLITGVAVGLESTVLPVITISIALVASYMLGQGSGLVSAEGEPIGGLYGTAVATMGTLGTAAYILAMGTLGPITDNAAGISGMSGQREEVRHRIDGLNATGNTTKALTKGYAIGTAALVAFLLFSAYLDGVFSYTGRRIAVDLANPGVFVAGLLGAMLVFWFSALAIKAVGRAAHGVIDEVRRQLADRPGIMAGTENPDYARCVDIVTVGALRAMIAPGALAIGFPLAVGLTFRMYGIGAEAVAAFLIVAAIAGILLASFFNSGGGAWDNARKYIETGMYGGRRSEAHMAAVVGDTVGDPFKDTAGPSLHVLVKLLATMTLVLAPVFI